MLIIAFWGPWVILDFLHSWHRKPSQVTTCVAALRVPCTSTAHSSQPENGINFSASRICNEVYPSSFLKMCAKPLQCTLWVPRQGRRLQSKAGRLAMYQHPSPTHSGTKLQPWPLVVNVFKVVGINPTNNSAILSVDNFEGNITLSHFLCYAVNY